MRRLSAILRQLAESREERLSVDMIAHAFGNHAFGAVMLVFGLLTMVAIAPGSTFIIGPPIAIVAWQVATGRHTLWLPRRIGARTVRPADIGRLNARFLHHLRRAERLLTPRLGFLFGRAGTRVIGLVCLVLSLIIILPIPLGNFLPGLAVALLSLSLIARDGLAALLGVVVAIAAVAVLLVVYGAVIVAFLAWLR